MQLHPSPSADLHAACLVAADLAVAGSVANGNNRQ